jgi:uncharacterized membrane protein (UPF0182 family)
MMENDLDIIQRTVPKTASTVQIPLLMEVSLSVTGIVVALSAGAAALSSIFARAPMMVVLFRTAITVLVVGLIGFLINWLIGKFLIKATLEKFSEELVSRSAEAVDTQA